MVEDEEVPREVIKNSLETLGYKVFEATNGRVALQELERNSVDLILTDIHMPVMDGIELLHKVRQNGCSMPVILITGFDPGDIHQVLKKYERTYFLMKPFRLMILKEMVEQALKEHK